MTQSALAESAISSELATTSFAPESRTIYSASGAVVQSTVVAGRVLMRDGEVEGAEEVLARALERARRLGLAPPTASAQGNSSALA